MAWPLTGRELEDERIRAAIDDPARRPLALVGVPGAGLSRLMEIAVEHGRRRGHHVCATVASPALRSVAFGAVAPFAANGGELDAGDRLGVIAALERDLLDAAAGAELLMVIDEAQWLDDASVALLERLRAHRRARIVVAVSDRPQPRVGGWSLATTETDIVDVAPLPRAAHDSLLEVVLDRPVTRETRQTLWDHTGGRPRDLELLLDAIDRAGVVDPASDVWQWSGSAVDSPGLRALVAEETADLGDGARRVFEYVALGAPMPGPVADVVLDDAAREELERAGLIESTEPGEESGLRPSRPLVGICVAARLGTTARRRILRDLAAVAPEPGAAWALRHARWAADAGIDIEVDDPQSLARGALAASDLRLAEQLARRAVDAAVDDVGARLLLAECLRRDRRGDEAAGELELASRATTTDDERADVAILRGQVALLLQRDPAGALRHLDAAIASVADADARRRLARERDLARGFVETVDLASGPEEGAGSALGDAELEELLVVALLAGLHLDLDGIDTVLARVRAAADDRSTEPFLRSRIAVCEHLAMIGRGAVGDAHAAARASLDVASGRGEPLGLWALCVAFSGPLVGDLDGAAVAAFDADRSFRALDPFGVRPFAAAVGASAAWQAGRADMAATLTAIAESSPSGADPRVAEIAAGRRRAWEAVLAGAVRIGAEHAAAAGRLAMDGGHCLWGVIGLHEAVRLGAPELVVNDLVSAASIDSALVGAFTAHATALAECNGGQLDSVAVDLAGLGCPLLAAEAAAQAALHDDDENARLRSAVRAETWWNRCSGRVPPALVDAPRALTDRQHQIAGLAARGLSSQEIADRLVVSRRTVDNHLRSVYRRLDVGGREELAAVLGPALG